MTDADPTLKNLAVYRQALARGSKQLIRYWIVAISLWLGLAAASFAVWREPSAPFISLLIVPLLGYVPAVRRRLRPLWALDPAMRDWAGSLGWTYRVTSRPNYQKHFQPALARIGVWEQHEQVVSGTFRGYPFQTYVHTFRQPFSYRYSRVATRVYCLSLPKELPHIFLRNRRSGNQYLNNVPRHFDNDQRLHLEGNFDEHFTAYTHRRTATEALSILAPNVMATLLDTNRQFDVEFVGNKLYLYASDYYTLADELADSLTTIERLIRHLDHKLRSWKFTLPNNRHYPYMNSRPGYGTVALGSTYFNKSWLFVTAYTAWSVLRIWLDPQDRWIKAAVVGSSDVVMIIVLLVMRRRYQLYRRNIGR